MATNPKLEEIANVLRRNQTTSMIAPNEYTDRTRSGQASIDRRNKMIELLQGQADAPIEKFSYGGIEAYTPPAAYLGKILSGAMAGYQSGKAGREQEALDKYKEQTQNEDMGTMIEMLKKGGTVPTDVSFVNDTSYIKDPDEREKQDKFLAGPVTSPSGEIIMSSSGQPLMPVNEIQAREYNFKTPEGQRELLRQTALDKQSRAEMLASQLDNQALLDKEERIANAALSKEERTAKAAIEAARLRQENKEAENLLKNQQDVDAAAILAKDNAAKAEKAAEQALKPKPLSAKDLNLVKNKYANISEIRKQYNTLMENFKSIKDTNAVGLLSIGSKFNENAQKYDAALSTLRNLILGLTRVPGVGSQSDLEARIANQALPERSYDKGSAAMEQQLNALGSLISGYDEVTKGILSDNNYEFPVEPEDPADIKTTVDNKKADSFTSPSDGQTYTRPANVTDEDWQRYKTKEGGK